MHLVSSRAAGDIGPTSKIESSFALGHFGAPCFFSLFTRCSSSKMSPWAWASTARWSQRSWTLSWLLRPCVPRDKEWKMLSPWNWLSVPSAVSYWLRYCTTHPELREGDVDYISWWKGVNEFEAIFMSQTFNLLQNDLAWDLFQISVNWESVDTSFDEWYTVLNISWYLSLMLVCLNICLSLGWFIWTGNSCDSFFMFSSVAQSCPTLCDPMTIACQTSLSITNPRSLLKLMSIELVMPSNHIILCCPLLLPLSIFPSIRVFSNESVLHIRWPKYWSFSFNISPSNEYSGLISFRMDWIFHVRDRHTSVDSAGQLNSKCNYLASVNNESSWWLHVGKWDDSNVTLKSFKSYRFALNKREKTA